ncbi:MAG: 2-amino-4-hydroxy-6-hydroxymethyldihydropteridine diphosphokinase [Candidatus Omnitrophica bacterium CG11_big_fil_rev_8_21_14_0_20_63_9]|nr:MAG: 2-amino-4-hydroxy-6-hydroxymethyldihydropteridine diphosphokinase [Candidatus Omnitrophica bacterium CG11_big_fil_rev_8_21_14_0_20_63_9]
MPRVFIGIGSNEGDRLTMISQAIRQLSATRGIRLVQMATIRETDPVGGPPQERYLNTVIEIETELAPPALLRTLQGIEHALGRRRQAERWGPRTIDLDLLLYDDRILHDPSLTVPHPRMHERRFVLEPLAELAPAFIHPVIKRDIAALLRELPAAHDAPTAS